MSECISMEGPQEWQQLSEEIRKRKKKLYFIEKPIKFLVH